MQTIEDIQIADRISRKYFELISKIAKYKTLSSGHFYFIGHSGQDIPTEFMASIKFAVINQLIRDTNIELDKLVNLDIDVSKQREELLELAREFM